MTVYENDPTWNSKNLDTIAKAQTLISGLLVAVVALLVAGLVLGIIGYNLVVDRLDNIETSTGQTVQHLETTP